jgi:hypothetical protein
MEKWKVWFVLVLGAFPKEGSGGIELQEHRIVSAIGADARYIHRTIGAERDPGSPKPPDGGPVPDPLPGSDPSGANFMRKILGLGLPNGSLVKLSVMPTTYDVPSAAVATPSDTSLPLPPQVVSDSSVWAFAVAGAKLTHSNPTKANNNIGIAERRQSAAEEVTHFGLLIRICFFMVNPVDPSLDVIDSELSVCASATNGHQKVTTLLLFDDARTGWRQRYKPQKGKSP